MVAIDIGPGATDRSTSLGIYTFLATDNSANDTGVITTWEFWFDVNYDNAQGVKVGTFYGSGTSYTRRDYETIGNVTKGSKQSFSGLNTDTVTGDYAGVYYSVGAIEGETEGQPGGLYYKTGDQFDAGTQTYVLLSGYVCSIYGSGTSTPSGSSSPVRAIILLE